MTLLRIDERVSCVRFFLVVSGGANCSYFHRYTQQASSGTKRTTSKAHLPFYAKNPSGIEEQYFPVGNAVSERIEFENRSGVRLVDAVGHGRLPDCFSNSIISGTNRRTKKSRSSCSTRRTVHRPDRVFDISLLIIYARN